MEDASGFFVLTSHTQDIPNPDYDCHSLIASNIMHNMKNCIGGTFEKN